MKIIIFQPQYPDPSGAASCISWQKDQFEKLAADNIDMIILPEYCNCPGIENADELRAFSKTEGKEYIEFLKKQAQRLECIICAGVIQATRTQKMYNCVIFIDQTGCVKYTYDKVHLTDSELQAGISPGSKIGLFSYNNIRYGFAVCFDTYFPEYFEALAEYRPDIIILPAYQRSETSERLEYLCRTRAVDSGCTILRSSYAMKDKNTGGCSMVVLPDGTITANAKGEAGILEISVNPQYQYVKAVSHGSTEHL